jgi:hypothetical protein
MQQPPSGQNWPQQGQPSYGYGQPGTQYPPQGPWQQPLPQQEQWQQPYGQPPPGWQPQRQPKKSRKGLWIALGIIGAVVVFGCVGISFAVSQASKSVSTAVNNAQSTVTNAQATINVAETQLPTSVPTKAATQSASGGNWTTTHTFTGNGTQKTAIFNVPGDWKIVYSCNGIIAGTASNGLLVVSVYGSNSTPIDPTAVNTTCKSGSALTNGETEEHQSGSIYLDINGTGDWTIQIQVPK